MKYNKWLSFVAAAALAATMTGCDAENGNDGVNGVDGKTPVLGVDYNVTDGEDGVTTTDLYEPETSDFRTPVQKAEEQMLIAEGLTVEYMTRSVAHHADMGEFYPYGSATPTHFITCVEGSTEEINSTTGKLNPSVQSISLSDGTVTTHLRGMNRCDGARVTPWNTILVTEESGSTGGAYEIFDIMNVTDHQVTDRDAGTIVAGIGSTTASTKVVKRDALMAMSWEGLVVLDSGVVIGGDELRPGTANVDADGGAMYKFIPSTLRTTDTNITDPSASPLVAGTAYALQVSCKDNTQQVGQGCEVGNGSWIEINASDATASADAADATGYYRPEDLHLDPTYDGTGVRFCWANTGNEGAKQYGEVMCAVDSYPNSAYPDMNRTVVVNRFVEGDTDFTSVDNLAFQPVSGNLYAIEDHKHGDIWACLPDGSDRDIKSDGCVKLLSLHDTSAEPTGFAFHPNGTEAYFFIQHSSDGNMDKVDDYGTDDMIKISGFEVPSKTVTSEFGAARDAELYANSTELFGFSGAKTSSFASDVDRNTTTQASETVDLATGLTASFLTRNVANKADMGDFWPKGDSPTHFVTCIEGSTEEINTTATLKLNPSVQAINLTDGTVTTLLRGMDRCDGLRITDWGTALATEETTAGSAYEILMATDPSTMTDYTVTDRGDAGAAATIAATATPSTAVTSAVSGIVKRTNLMAMSWEGLAVLPSGVVIGGDELRPGTANADADGGSMFKFVPTTERTATTAITDLANSPLASGKTYAMQVSCRDSKQQVGQGCEIGNAAWIEVTASDARASADENNATGYYRPEDLHLDPTYVADSDTPDAVRFCWTNTGNEGTGHYGEIICGVDYDPMTADADTRSVVVNRFVEGDTDFTSVDNLAFQPTSGNVYGIEDHKNGDIWACLPDGKDRDIKSDGCIRLLSVKDQSAEPTGFAFHPNGQVAYLFVQHSDDTGIAKVDDYGTDDMIMITGFGTAEKVGFDTLEDFGQKYQELLHLNSQELFGFGRPIVNSSEK